jgi:hypothetical protein
MNRGFSLNFVKNRNNSNIHHVRDIRVIHHHCCFTVFAVICLYIAKKTRLPISRILSKLYHLSWHYIAAMLFSAYPLQRPAPTCAETQASSPS